MRHPKSTRVLFAFLTLALALAGFSTKAERAAESTKRFEKEGLVFDFAEKWELSDQSNAAAQQLVLTEKALDAQIMIVAMRGALTSAKQEEEAKASLIEPGISRVLKQYEDSGIKVSRSPLKVELSGAPAEGVQLRFEVDRNAGTTEICWGVIGKRLVQLFFIRPDKTSAETGVCWNLIRTSLKVAAR
jgi:hypothetical protein